MLEYRKTAKDEMAQDGIIFFERGRSIKIAVRKVFGGENLADILHLYIFHSYRFF
jgi:hypothetical protein